MRIFSSSKFPFVLIVSLWVADATLEPLGTVSVDCGSAQNFTCMAPGVPLGWNIAGLKGINIPGPFRARPVALENPRITSTDTGGTLQIGVSVITISGFIASDNGGIIQCVNMGNNSTKGMATISIDAYDRTPSCPSSVMAVGKGHYNTITVSWQQPSNTPPVTFTTVTYCPTSLPNCGNSVTCTSPCTISGLDPGTEYQFTVIPTNNCGSATGCTGISTTTVQAATLESESTVSVGCGNAQNFICMAPGVPIGWNIAGLSGINLPGPFLARNASIGNSRITSTDNGAFLQIGVSDIIISEFIISDNGGIIQCVNMNNNSTIGMATISVDDRIPSCPLSVVAVGKGDNDAITVAWQHPPNTPPVTFTTVTYCPTSSPNCGNSMTCTSPCTISGLDPNTEYQFTVIPNTNCRSSTGCTGNMATVETACKMSCPTCASQPCTSQPCASQSCTCPTAPLLAGIIPTVVLANVVTGVFVFLITRHCYKKTSRENSPSKDEDAHDQVSMEGPKTSEDIEMTDNPAYSQVK